MTSSTIVGPGIGGERAVWSWNLAAGSVGEARIEGALPHIEDLANPSWLTRGPARPEARNIEDPESPITWSMLAEMISGPPAGSGKHVTPYTAMNVSAVFACVRVIAWGIARMPLITYQRTDAGRERAAKHSNYRLLKLRPNPKMSSFAFRSAVISNALLWGGGYAEIVRTSSGRINALYPIESWRVRPFEENGQLLYQVSGLRGEAPIRLLPRDILHIPGLSFNGIDGLSVVGHARQTIGAALASDEFSGTLLKNGMRPSGTLTHPGKLGDQAFTRLRTSFQELYGGAANAGKPIILEEGMSWSSNAMPLQEAQFVESGYFRVEDICRWFGVPPHKIQHLLRATNNNIEQQSLDFLGDTLSPWVEAAEQEINYKLFSESEQESYYAEHLTQAIVQLDANARGQLYERLFRIGVMSPDQICERENLNKLPDGRGAAHWTQGSNMPLPTPAERDEIIQAWIRKGLGSQAKEPAEPREDGLK